MSLRYGILGLLAFLIILLLVFKNYETWTLPMDVVPEKGAVKKSGIKIESHPLTEDQKEPASIASFILIAEKNIFHPERKEFPVLPDPSKDKKPMVRPQIILYGVTIAGDYKSASIAQQGRALARGERAIMTVKIGDRIGDYKLGNILPDRIMLEAQEDSFEVLLYDPNMPKKRVYARTENKPAMVTSAVSTPAPTTTPAASPSTIPSGETRPGDHVRGGISESRVPTPVTPAPVPAPRTRRLPSGGSDR